MLAIAQNFIMYTIKTRWCNS